MTATEPGDHGLLVIIVLTVRPAKQQDLIDTIRSAGDPAQVPGLRSLTLLRSLDGTQVINQMSWDSREAYERARAHVPAIESTAATVQRLVEDASTNFYRRT